MLYVDLCRFRGRKRMTTTRKRRRKREEEEEEGGGERRSSKFLKEILFHGVRSFPKKPVTAL